MTDFIGINKSNRKDLFFRGPSRRPMASSWMSSDQAAQSRSNAVSRLWVGRGSFIYRERNGQPHNERTHISLDKFYECTHHFKK